MNSPLLRGIVPVALMILTSSGNAWSKEGHTETAPGTPPGEALKQLEEGNKRFLEGSSSQNSKSDANRRKELTTGQKPSAVVLSCSDSRVPPELIFDQGLGEIFTVRVAGNVLGAATVASIEYALEHLGTRLIVVMGHESCGAVKAALTTPIGQSAGTPDLDTLIASIQPYLEKVDRSIASTDKTLKKAVGMNVDAVADRLFTRSKIVRKHIEQGLVKIVRAIYRMESGQVEFWGTEGIAAESRPRANPIVAPSPTTEPK